MKTLAVQYDAGMYDRMERLIPQYDALSKAAALADTFPRMSPEETIDEHLVPGCGRKAWMEIGLDESGRVMVAVDSEHRYVRVLLMAAVEAYHGRPLSDAIRICDKLDCLNDERTIDTDDSAIQEFASKLLRAVSARATTHWSGSDERCVEVPATDLSTVYACDGLSHCSVAVSILKWRRL